MTDRALLDAHTHVWTMARHPQAWIDPSTMAVIDRDFSVSDLVAAIDRAESERASVTGAVIVQASNSLSETMDILTEAANVPEIEGVVGWVDLTSPSMERDLDQLEALVGGEKLHGIRHLAHEEEDERWLAGEDVDRGLDALGRRGLAFDLVVRAPQLGVAREVVLAHPGTRFVLDHLGKPPIASGELTAWEAGLRAIANAGNVVAKVSGLTIEADWASWSPASIRPVLDTALEAFGPERLMFGSDWPLVELPGGYSGWLDAYLDWSAGLSPSERLAMDSGTARRTYGSS